MRASFLCRSAPLPIPTRFISPPPQNLSFLASSPSFLSSSNQRRMESTQKLDNQKDPTKIEELKKEEKVQTPPPPPPLQPPEKPLPGDCCGSGCVRCVWDIYYEELEDYNKSLSNSPQKDH